MYHIYLVRWLHRHHVADTIDSVTIDSVTIDSVTSVISLLFGIHFPFLEKSLKKKEARLGLTSRA